MSTLQRRQKSDLSARLQVGYRASTEGTKKLILALGLSHPVEMAIPAGLAVKVSFAQKEGQSERSDLRSGVQLSSGAFWNRQLAECVHRRRKQVDANVNITISGIDKYKVGQFAAEVREWRKPEPYKVCASFRLHIVWRLLRQLLSLDILLACSV